MKNLLFFLFVTALFSCSKPENTPGPPVIPPSTENSVTSFIFKMSENAGLTADVAGIISNDTIRLTVPYAANITALKPTISHTGVSISPASGVVQNFANPVNYIVTAESGTQHRYVVIVKVNIKSTVFIASANKLFALDGESGTVKWTLTLGGQVVSEASPAYNNGIVYIGSNDGNMNAVDAVTGLIKWKYLIAGGAPHVTPTVNGGVLYFGAAESLGSVASLYALNATTGSLVWKYVSTATDSPLGNPTVSGGKIFISKFLGLFSFNATNGQPLLGFNGSICGNSNPLVINSVMYAPTESTIITAFNTSTAAVLWTFGSSIGTGVKCSPTYSNGKIFHGGSSGYLYAIDLSGNMVWRFIPSDITNSFFASPVVANGMVYAANTDSYIFAVDENTGVQKWEQRIPSSGLTYLQNNCTVKDDIVFVGSNDYNIYALNAFTGAIIWQYNTGAAFYGGACVVREDNNVYNPGISGEHQ